MGLRKDQSVAGHSHTSCATFIPAHLQEEQIVAAGFVAGLVSQAQHWKPCLQKMAGSSSSVSSITRSPPQCHSWIPGSFHITPNALHVQQSLPVLPPCIFLLTRKIYPVVPFQGDAVTSIEPSLLLSRPLWICCSAAHSHLERKE